MLTDLCENTGVLKKMLKIKNRQLSSDNPFIIAEAGINHNGSVETAKLLIDEAKECGADCIKFQTYRTEKLIIKNKKTSEFYDLLKRHELSFNDFEELKKHAESRKIIFMSTPDDMESLKFLIKLKIPAIKIGSGEIDNYSLLREAALSKRVVILSTGASNIAEINKAASIILKENRNLVILHCVSEYPADVQSMNLRFLNTLSKRFRVPVGLSDHTDSLAVPAAAVALGASVIEKHFTLDRDMDGPDHSFSLDPSMFREMVKIIKEAASALGSDRKEITERESALRKQIRKSLYTAVNIKDKEALTQRNTILLRPQLGIPASESSSAMGAILQNPKNAYKPIYSDDIAKKEDEKDNRF